MKALRNSKHPKHLKCYSYKTLLNLKNKTKKGIDLPPKKPPNLTNLDLGPL